MEEGGVERRVAKMRRLARPATQAPSAQDYGEGIPLNEDDLRSVSVKFGEEKGWPQDFERSRNILQRLTQMDRLQSAVSRTPIVNIFHQLHQLHYLH